MLPLLMAAAAAKGGGSGGGGAGGGIGLTDTSSVSQTISGNNFGGVNFGNSANTHAMPSFIADRLTNKPQAIAVTDNPLMLVIGVSALVIIGALVMRKAKK